MKDRFSLVVLHNLMYVDDRRKLANYLLKNNFILLNGTNFHVSEVLNEYRAKYDQIIGDIKKLNFKQPKQTININTVCFDFSTLKNIS